MPDELTTTVTLPARARARRGTVSLHRVRHGMRHTHNWLQLARFGAVGASGYVVNLAVFAICVHLMAIDYHLSAVIAWALSVLNNFFWNRHWTFGAKEEHPVRQGMRFFLVSFLVLLLSLGIYQLLVHSFGISQHTLADGIAWIIATPISFVVQKLWSFKA